MFYFYNKSKKIKSNKKIPCQKGFLITHKEDDKVIVNVREYFGHDAVDDYKIHPKIVENLNKENEYIIVPFEVNEQGEDAEDVINETIIKLKNIIGGNIAHPNKDNVFKHKEI